MQVGVPRGPDFSRRAVREVNDVLKDGRLDVAVTIQNVDVTEPRIEVPCYFTLVRHRPLDERLTRTWREVELTVVPLVDRTGPEVLSWMDTNTVLVLDQWFTWSTPVTE
ncbi:hypothetical protein D3C75_664500 [compost metagenome]